MPNKAKPFLRWAGSKKKLLPHLIKHWDKNQFDGYIEPFVGSAQLYFSITSKESIIGDSNSELILLYNTIRDYPYFVHEKLLEYNNSKELYYKLRAILPENLSNIERAARFIYLNRFCFNGLYRTNLKGEFNVPYGGLRTGCLPSLEELIKVSEYLKKTIIENNDFETVVKNNLKPNYFVYMDPPYAVENVRIFTQYNPVTFGKLDLERLSNLCNTINKSNSNFLVSYADSPEALDIFKHWNIEKIQTQRFIAGFGKNRKKANEILIFN